MIRKRFRAHLRNAVFRIAKGIPPGSVSPVVANDRFQQQSSLFRFLGAFAANRRTLYVGDQAYGAFLLQRDFDAEVTAVMPASARWFGRARFGFVSAPARERYDVVIAAKPAGELEADGKMLVVGERPAPERFANVRRFVQRSNVAVDLASPLYSIVPSDAFTFEESEAADRLEVVTLATNDPKWREPQLHIGCGPVALPGWINVDIKPYPGVDFCADVLRGIPFRGVKHIFAEHFIEHLSYADAAKFVSACRAALRDDGILRLSTPNLDWVAKTSYVGDDRLRDCFDLNRAFRAWGHQFLYNSEALEALLQNAGFATIRSYAYGQSDTPALAGLEHHEQYPDYRDEPHILIVEASGRADRTPIRGEAAIELYLRDLSSR